MNSRSIRIAIAAGALLGALVRGGPAAAQSFFRDGDTWVLSGDSITYIGLYRQTVKDVLDHFHPGNSITVVDTAKWGQLTAEADGKGLERKPAVVTIMLGMNNVIHHDYPVVHDFTKGAKAYAENLRRQVRKYKKCGAEVVLMAPTLSDSTENSYFSPWNTEQGLRVYGEAVRRLCDEEMCRFVPVAAEFEEAKKDLKAMQTYITDGVHPYGWGQYVIARSLVHHLRVAEPFAKADEPRGFDAGPIVRNDFGFSAAKRFAAAADEQPEIAITAPKACRAVVAWSVEGSQLHGSSTVDFADAPHVFRVPVPAAGLPSGAGRISRLVVSVTPEDRRARIAVVDLARTRVIRMENGSCSGEVTTEDRRPEGPKVADWRIEERGPDLWFTGKTYASSFPARPEGPQACWMNSSGMNGIMMMLDLRPADRFADNNFDRDMHMVCFSVLDDPWSVLPLAWEGRTLQNCLYGGVEPTEGGYLWRIGLRGHVVNYRAFDIRKYDHFGVNMVFDDVDDKGEIGRYPIMPYPDMETLTPERRLNQTIVIDRKGDVPQAGGETTNVGVFAL